jgi:transposase-like protein
MGTLQDVPQRRLTMSRRYTSDEKSRFLNQLYANHGNIALTHLQTGVPERTLFAWRREDWLQQRQQRHTPLPPQEAPPPIELHRELPEIPTFDDDLEAVKYLRSQMMKELVNVGASLTDGIYASTPYQRVLVLSQLLDRLIKLDAHLQPYTPVEQIIRFEYADPDEMEDTVP